MTEYSDMVEEARILMAAEEWAEGVKYIHLNNGVIETKFNNGDLHYQETKDRGKSWTVSRNLSEKSLIERMLRWKTSKK